MVEELQKVISEHDAKGKLLKEDATIPHDPQDLALEQPPAEQATDVDKLKGKEKEHSPEDDISLDDSPTQDLPKTPAGEEHAVKRRALVQRLRECNLVLHKVMFLKGDVYHVLGEQHSKDEDTAYQKAEELRKRLLKCLLFIFQSGSDADIHVH